MNKRRYRHVILKHCFLLWYSLAAISNSVVKYLAVFLILILTAVHFDCDSSLSYFEL